MGDERAKMVHEWYEMGLNDWKIEENAKNSGFHLGHGVIGRHRKLHLTDKLALDADEGMAELDDLEALDAIIKRGQTQIKNWKLTPSEYFKAMEMKYKISSGSSMDAMYAAMASAGADSEDDEEGENQSEGVEEGGEEVSPLRGPLPVVGATSGPKGVAE